MDPRYGIRDDMATVRIFGRCPVKGCRHRHVTDAPAVTENILDARKSVIGTYQRPLIKHPAFPDAGWWHWHWFMLDQIDWPAGAPDDRPRCPTHRRLLKWETLQATFNLEKVCDGRCRGATGPNCECSCNGEQHGADAITI
ncbi:hypothetical protein ACFY05_33010 [Microtetraspora fusca]|uniref:Uncharacterized protein n=1 Tax=Microtetraspora fusca TaxID=1997 RepID=A0ABW6VE83_MICFU